MIYNAKSIDRKSFLIENEANETISQIAYEKWYSIKAEIITPKSKYIIKPKNILETSIYVLEEDNLKFIFKMNFRREILIKDMVNNKKYKLKSRGIKNIKLYLVDSNNNVLAGIHPEFIQKNFTFNYTMKVNEKFEALPNNELFIPLLFHCCNYIIDIYILLLSKNTNEKY